MNTTVTQVERRLPPQERAMPAFLTAHHELVSAIAAGGLLLVGFALARRAEGGIATAGEAMIWISLGIGLVYGGIAAWEAIRGLEPNIDVLMVVGAVLAASLGHPEEGALLLFLFVLSGALEDLAMERTRSAVTALSRLIPIDTRVRRNGDWVEAVPEELEVGDVVLVRPGEQAPTDGVVVAGTTEFNQASLTGEPMPRPVAVGDAVFAGTINESHPVEVRVTKAARDSSLQRVLELVKAAQERRQPLQQIIDRVSTPYTLTVFAVSLLAFLALWAMPSLSAMDAAYRAIVLLIVASPCALIIATPTATLSAISRAARGGVLFKGGDALERLARVKSAAFDKTGTLTVGRPVLQAVEAVAWSDFDRVLGLAAGLEQGSTHPIGTAIIEEAQKRGIAPIPVQRLRFVPGHGVTGEYQGHPVRLGRYRHVADVLPVCFQARVRELLDTIHEQGGMAVALAWQDQAGVFILRDMIRPGALEMVQGLHELNVRPIVMLTGDVEGVARRLGEHLGLDEVHAELMPEEKLEIVERLKRTHGPVAVVGDGVNDAPALAASDVAVAVGGIGSDVALEAADVIALNDDLRAGPWAIRLARAARRTIIVNLVVALTAIVILAIGAVLGYVNMSLGVLGHEGGTLLVVANGLRLLAFRGLPSLPAERIETEGFEAELDLPGVEPEAQEPVMVGEG